MTQGNVTDEEVADLIRRTAEPPRPSSAGTSDLRHARPARGRLHADGAVGRRAQARVRRSDQALDALARYFQGGEAELQVVQSYASGDMVVVVVVAIERQHGAVGGLPDQDWSLRVTLVFRREGGEWWLVHRHADPLVHGITQEQLAAIARGDPGA